MLWSSTWTCKCCYVRWNFESRGDWPLLKQLPPQESPITGVGRNKNCPQSSLCGVHLCKYTPSYTPIRSSIYNAVPNTDIENQFRSEREKYHKHLIKVPEFPMQGGRGCGGHYEANSFDPICCHKSWFFLIGNSNCLIIIHQHIFAVDTDQFLEECSFNLLKGRR